MARNCLLIVIWVNTNYSHFRRPLNRLGAFPVHAHGDFEIGRAKMGGARILMSITASISESDVTRMGYSKEREDARTHTFFCCPDVGKRLGERKGEGWACSPQSEVLITRQVTPGHPA